jgi:hypothetical protein
MDGFSKSCPGCHSQAGSASSAYTWLKGGGQINGKGSAIVQMGQSRLVIFGGSMPPGGGIDPAAQCALVQWVAAGAQNN